jgi:Rod binding domain-containing protein
VTLSADFSTPNRISGSDVTSSSFRPKNANLPVPNSVSPADRKLRAAAADFESLLLSNLWKSMKSTFASTDDDSDDAAHDTLEDMGIQAMSAAVGKAGGLGLGKLILKHLEPKLEHSNNSNPSPIGKAFSAPADISP